MFNLKNAILLGLAAVIAVGFSVYPSYKEKKTRDSLYENTYRVEFRNADNQTVGYATSFILNYNDKKYMMTNKHVCYGGTLGKMFIVDDINKTEKETEALYVDKNSDICIIKNSFNSEGLYLAETSPAVGDSTYTMGFPDEEKKPFIKGEVFSSETFETGMFEASTDEQQLICYNYGGNVVVIEQPINLGPFIINAKFDVCVTKTESVRTTNLIYPGISGSPMLNYNGEVIGIVFAYRINTRYSYVTTLEDTKKALDTYLSSLPK